MKYNRYTWKDILEMNKKLNDKKSKYINHYFLKQTRLVKLKNVNFKCEKCGKKAKQVHHIDRTKYNHDIKNLMALCIACHANIHKESFGRPKNPNSAENKTKTLAKRIGVASQTLKKYMNGKRNMQQRTLSILNKYFSKIPKK